MKVICGETPDTVFRLRRLLPCSGKTRWGGFEIMYEIIDEYAVQTTALHMQLLAIRRWNAYLTDGH